MATQQLMDLPQYWAAFERLPAELPTAKEYWLVFRFEGAGVPELRVIPELTRVVQRLHDEALRRGLPVTGIQFDIDSPTNALPQYATFLREVRKGLPKGFQISITALLDWFRTGTAMKAVVKEADEFVPQFYDVQANRYSSERDFVIATRFHAAKWGPIFNGYGKRFRIGISTFGRSLVIREQRPAEARYNRAAVLSDVKPLDIAVEPAFQLQTSRTDADELVLTYRATRKTTISYYEFAAGDAVQFILSTHEAIRAAVSEAKSMGGNCAGVVFFRWPAQNESLTARPDEVLAAAGVGAHHAEKAAGLAVVDGDCAAVSCVDLFLVNDGALSPKSIRYRIDSSTELEYFLPAERMPVRMSGSSQLELLLPPYCGRRRMYLGRAVTAKRAEFQLREQQ